MTDGNGGEPGGTPRPTIACGLPPGWIELGAWSTRTQLDEHLNLKFAADGDKFDDQQRAAITEACGRAFDVLSGQDWLNCGAVMTHLPRGEALVPTMWHIGVGLLRVPGQGELNPVAVAERVLGRAAAPDDMVEGWESFDRRHGVAVGTTVAVEPPGTDVLALLDDRMPQYDFGGLGVVYLLLPVPGLPPAEYMGLTMAVTPSADERQAVAYLAAQMATSLHVVDKVSDVPAERLLVNVTVDEEADEVPQR